MSAGCMPSACAFWFKLSRLLSLRFSVSAWFRVRVISFTSCLRFAIAYAVWVLMMIESVPMRSNPRVKLCTSL